MPIENPTHHTCCTCGYTWLHGQHGGHSCAQIMAVTIAEQALEIERLKRAAQTNWNEFAEGMKAQPRGVVLPERLDFPHRDEFESADQYAAAIGESKKWNACLDEVARLNSSPVSAGDDDDQAYDAEAERLTAEALGTGTGINPNATSIDDIFLSESAGGVDERAAFEAWFRDKYDMPSCVPFNWSAESSRLLLEGWQARAALTASAPNHSEQVREAPSVQITGHLDEVDAPIWEFINAEARNLGPITGSIDSYGLSRPNGGQPNGGVAVLWNGPKIHAVALAVRDAMNRTVCIRLLAAPSPASQKGDV